MQSTKPIPKGQIADFVSSSTIQELTKFLKLDGYVGSAKDLETLIIAASTGASGISIVPTSPAPSGTGIASFTAIQAGTYTNYGGLVVSTNSFAIISRSASGVFSISQTAFDLTTYAKISDVKNDLISTDVNKPLSALQGKLLNESVTVVKKIKELQLDRFPFVDQFGNVMFEIGVSGSKSAAYRIFDPITNLEVVALNKAWFDNLMATINSIPRLNNLKETSKPDGFYYTDYIGNVIAKLTKNGLQAIKFLNKNGDELGSASKKLDNKLVVSIGDSHQNSAWLPKFCDLTGSTQNTALQTAITNNQYNYTDSGLMMGIAKALNQYTIDNAITPNVILIENCHFASDKTKTIKDYVPMIYDNLKIYGTTYASYSALLANINADKTAFISSLVPTLKTALRFNFSTFKHTITFSSSGVLTAGTMQLTIDGAVFPINVTAGQTLAQAVTALNDWAFYETVPNWTNISTKGAARTTTIELVYTGSANSPTSPTVSFSAGTTGMTMTTNVLSSTVAFQDYFFNSLTLTDWNSSIKWLGTNGTTAYPAMMGLIEYLQTKYPLAEIIVWGVQWLAVSNTPSSTTSYLVETFTGSGVYKRNIHKYYENAQVDTYLHSKKVMAETAKYYNCRFLDVDTACGISLFNMFNGYYGENNLHPLTLGYEKWGETLAKLY